MKNMSKQMKKIDFEEPPEEPKPPAQRTAAAGTAEPKAPGA
jgi:hypothetical protein